jgi:hypothetical protein
LEGVSLKNNKAHTYKITFYGETISLKDTFGEDKLSVIKIGWTILTVNAKQAMTLFI